MIPKGLFNQEIDEGAEELPRLRDLLVCSLIESRFNINHHGNVILLPMDTEVAIMYRLPRHLVLEDETEIEEEGSTKFDHGHYNMVVDFRLQIIIQNYKQACDAALRKDCDTKFVELSKAQLERLERDCYAEITEHARTGGTSGLGGGRPVSELKAIRRHTVANLPY